MYRLYFAVNTRVDDADIRQFTLRLILQRQIVTAISEIIYSDIRKFDIYFLQQIILNLRFYKQ